MKAVKNIITILLVFLGISYVLSQTKNVEVENAIEYFKHRNEALSLVKAKKWQGAIPILESLAAKSFPANMAPGGKN